MSKSFHLNKIGCYPFLHDVYRRTLNIQTFKSVYKKYNKFKSAYLEKHSTISCMTH